MKHMARKRTWGIDWMLRNNRKQINDADQIAAVLVNRLRKGIKLESDATVLFGLAQGAVNWNRPLVSSDLKNSTPFNTYVIEGLPPAPITMPSRKALEATLNPAATQDLFFVADGRGGHLFAPSKTEHHANVHKLRKLYSPAR